MKYLLLFFSLLSLAATACDLPADFLEAGLDMSFMDDTVQAIKETTCDNFAKYQGTKTGDYQKYIDNIRSIAKNQTNQIWKIKNRHVMGMALAQCTPDIDTKALVITFAGTSSYNPRAHSIMAELIQCNKFQHMQYKHKKNAHWPIMKYLQDTNSKFQNKFDMVASGPLAFFLKDHELNKQARYFKFASFASEEVEALGDGQAAKELVISLAKGTLPLDAVGIPGITNALSCVENFFKEAKTLGISPKLIVMGHSSGARSSVKFLELLKTKSYAKEADLVVSLDAVKEAHTVAAETALKMAVKYTSPLTTVDTTVQSKKQPELLYKTSNAKKWIAFYQKSDSNGIGAGFGIYGSPIVGADSNTFVDGLGAKGHGEICQEYSVNNKIKTEILDLFK